VLDKARVRTAAIVGVALLALLGAPVSVGAVPGFFPSVSMPVPHAWGAKPDLGYSQLSCSGLGDCTAIGAYTDRSGRYLPAADTEVSGHWSTPVALSLPPGVKPVVFVQGLRSISCPSAGNCTAVGELWFKSTPWQPVVAVETAGTWGAITTGLPLPAGASLGGLDAVRCSDPTDCVAAGWAGTANGPAHGFVDTETAGAWGASVVLATPSSNQVHGAVSTYPDSISCTSPTACVIVGGFEGPPEVSPTLGFATIESAGSWSTPTVFAPRGSAQVILGSVDCAAPGSCVAGGVAGPTFQGQVPYVVRLASGHWHGTILRYRYASPLTWSGNINAVSCASTTSCVAVGAVDNGDAGLGNTAQDGEFPAAYTLSGTTWSNAALLPMPRSGGRYSGGAQLDSIVCPVQGLCESTGVSSPAGASTQVAYPFDDRVLTKGADTAPYAPTRLTAVAHPGTFVVRWGPPTSDGGSPILSYRVIATSPHSPTLTCTTVANSCQLRGVRAKRTYVVRATALNAAGLRGHFARVIVRST
jgi:hypothetical protein